MRVWGPFEEEVVVGGGGGGKGVDCGTRKGETLYTDALVCSCLRFRAFVDQNKRVYSVA